MPPPLEAPTTHPRRYGNIRHFPHSSNPMTPTEYAESILRSSKPNLKICTLKPSI